MKFSKPQHLLVLTAPVKFGRSSHLGVTVGFGFRLSDPRILAHETEIWAALESAPMSFKALDEAMPKPFAEWLLAGHARRPANLEADGKWRVQLGVDDCHKEIFCHLPGEQAAAADAAIPLDYVNAFGGAGFLANPVGMGHESAERRDKPLLRLPDRYGQENEFLAATGPLDTRWAQRAAHVSRKKKDLTLDTDHRSHLGWPETMDRRFFQMAPRDQWARGDSWPVTCAYSLHGVGEGGAGFVGQIPPLEAQAIYRRADSQEFAELPLKRQTLWFFPDRDVGAVLFTGLLDVDDMLGDEIGHLLVALSEFGTPYPLNYLSVVARRREDSSCNQIEGMRDEVLLPPAGRGWAWEYLLLPEDHPRVAQPARPYARVRERMQHYLGMVAAAAEATDKAKTQDIAQVKEQTRALIRGEGLPETEADKMDWRRQLAAWPRERRRDDLIIRNADLSGLDFSGQSWQGSQLINVDLSGCRFVDVDLRNMLMLGCKLDGASFENAVFDSCHLSECSLTWTRWKATQLATVQFIECDFTACTVQESQWKTTFFSESRGSQLSFARVACDSVQMQKCSFPALSFAESTVDGHVFLDCQLPGLQVSQSVWRKTSWVACQLAGSQFVDSRFTTAVLADACDISGSRWTQCLFEKVFLGAARFNGGICEHCTWVEATMNALQASGSQWIGCDLRQGNLMHADFSGSRFQASALRDANLYGADLRASEIHASNLIGANLGYVRREKNWQKKWKDNLMGRVIEVPRRQD